MNTYNAIMARAKVELKPAVYNILESVDESDVFAWGNLSDSEFFYKDVRFDHCWVASYVRTTIGRDKNYDWYRANPGNYMHSPGSDMLKGLLAVSIAFPGKTNADVRHALIESNTSLWFSDFTDPYRSPVRSMSEVVNGRAIDFSVFKKVCGVINDKWSELIYTPHGCNEAIRNAISAGLRERFMTEHVYHGKYDYTAYNNAYYDAIYNVGDEWFYVLSGKECSTITSAERRAFVASLQKVYRITVALWALYVIEREEKGINDLVKKHRRQIIESNICRMPYVLDCQRNDQLEDLRNEPIIPVYAEFCTTVLYDKCVELMEGSFISETFGY